MSEAEPIISVRDLCVNIKMDEGLLTPVRGISFDIRPGETLGLVGESGCGKSLTSKAILAINDKKCSSTGQILFRDEQENTVDILKMDPRGKEIRAIRGKQISMIFQEPMVAFSPMYTIGNQINECTRLHITKDKVQSKKITLDMMEKVGIANAVKRYDQYPHEFSGGMLQRALIAMALVCRPRLLIADEPTTALDVTVQKQVLDLLNARRKELGTAVILITHDLGVVKQYAHRIQVMYAGSIVESAETSELLTHPRHAYTRALMSSIPGTHGKGEHLPTIPGLPPTLKKPVCGCAFRPRNIIGKPELCLTDRTPELVEISPRHFVRNCPGCLS